MKIKLLTIPAMVLVTGLLLFAGATSAASVSEDVHGISYKDNSLVKLAVVPGSGISFENIDWYITGSGNVEIYTDGVLTDTLSVSGLYIHKASYEPGKRYNVSITLNGSSNYHFIIDVRSTISVSDIDPEAHEPDTVTMSNLRLQIMYLMIGLASGLAVAMPIWYSYRRRRELNKRTVINK